MSHNLWYNYRGQVTVMRPLARRGLVFELDDEYRLFCPAFAPLIIEELTSPVAQASPPTEEQQREKISLPQLSESVRNNVERWISSSDTRYRNLFLAWMSDPATAEATYDLLTDSPIRLQALQETEGQRQGGSQSVATVAVGDLSPYGDAELLITPSPGPVTLLRLCQWLKEFVKAEVEGLDDTQKAYTSLRISVRKRIPLVEMLADLPGVAEVRVEPSPRREGSGEPTRRLRLTLKPPEIPGVEAPIS